MATREILKSSARVAYSVLFMFSMVFAWMLRDFAKPVISRIPWIIKQFSKDGETPPDEWFGEQAVFRLSLGNFLLFSVLALIMAFPAPVKFKDDWRDKHLHHGGWALKAIFWLLFNILPFFFSNGVITLYAGVSKFVSPLFLAIQTLIIIDATNAWNETWVAEGEEDDRYLYALLIATLGAYGGAATLAILSYVWFAPSDYDCSLNISLITVGLIACIAFNLATFHPTIRERNQGASIFVGSCTAFYVMYLGFSALQSEPREYECNILGQRLNAASSTTLAAGMLLTLTSTVWAAFRAGSNTHTFSTDLDDAQEQLLEEAELTSAGLDGIPPKEEIGMDRTSRQGHHEDQLVKDREYVTYNYTQFYLIFALASMYVGMLMTGWGSGTVEKDLIDVGWTSVAVKTAAQWIAVILYSWTLIAPVVFPDRDF
eukprot:jgi/Picsp_1/1544/NSC_05022-R1_probable serine incorporator-like